jgi:DNA polymerase III delta subunit
MYANEIIKGKINGGAYLLDGGDDYLLKTAVEAFCALLPKNSLSLHIVDEFYDVNEIFSPLFVFNPDDEPNVVIVRFPDAKLDSAAHSRLKKLLSSEIAPNFLVFANAPYLNAEEKKLTVAIDCGKPNKSGCVNYICGMLPCGIETSAAYLIADYTQCNMAKISNECRKLASYCEGKRVTVNDVNLLVAEDRELQLYAFANDIVSGKNSAAMRELDKMRSLGVAPAFMLSTLVTSFQRMLYAAISPLGNEELAKIMNIKPYAVQKARESKNFGKARLNSILDMLVGYEYKFKSGEMSDAAAFDCAVSELLSKE